MSSQVPIFGGPRDYKVLRAYIESIGLRILPLTPSQLSPTGEDSTIDRPEDGPASYLSFRPALELHTYGNPPGYSDAIDPLIDFIRPYYKPPFLVAGRIYWDDYGEFGKLTKPYYMKLSRWLKQNWNKVPNDRLSRIGPEAERLWKEGKARLSYLPPGATVETVWVDDDSKSNDM